MILVTGGGGFLGKAIVRDLLTRGERVRSFARGAYPDIQAMGAEVYRGDLADSEAVSRAAAGCSAVIHVGAKAGYWGRYEDYHQANVVGTQNVIVACQQHNIPHLVYTSSPSVVDAGKDIAGGDESLPYPERHAVAYSATKAEAERLALAANSATLRVVAIRPPLIWGPGDNHLVPRIMARAKTGRLARIGRRECLLDTTYIDNASDAHLLALDKLRQGANISGKVYFISNGEPLPVETILNRIISVGGYPPLRYTIPAGLAMGAATALETAYRLLPTQKEPPVTRFLVEQLTKSRWFNIDAARRDLGYVPRVSFDEGLERLKSAWQSKS